MRSWYSLGDNCALYFAPFPDLKYSPIAFSPECPKGGFPMSCITEAAATIAPKSLKVYPKSAKFGWRSNKTFPTFLPRVRPTTETSKLCVKRVCTKSVSESGITWVLSCRLLKADENIIRSKSTSNPKRVSSCAALGRFCVSPARFKERRCSQFMVLI